MKKLRIVKKILNEEIKDVYDIQVDQDQHYLLENGIVSHNSGFVYASSIVIATRKLKLKEDEDGNKTTDVKGIRCQAKVMKSRYAKPFETVEIKIPWDKGMDEYSGLIELFEQKGLFVKDGNKLRYSSLNGTEYKYFRKQITNELLDLMMNEFEIQLENSDNAKEEIKEGEDQ